MSTDKKWPAVFYTNREKGREKYFYLKKLKLKKKEFYFLIFIFFDLMWGEEKKKDSTHLHGISIIFNSSNTRPTSVPVSIFIDINIFILR